MTDLKKINLIFIVLLICIVQNAHPSGEISIIPNPQQISENRKTVVEMIIKYPFSFFDGFKIQLTNSHPKLTHVNHQIDFINDIARTNLRGWDSKDIFTIDLVLWKDLSKYFKADFAVALSSGALETSSTALRNTLNLNTRFRQRYDVLLLWSNLYYYPFAYNFKEHKSDRLIDPFVGGGIGITFIREETSIKFRRLGFYNRVLTNFNEKNVGYKVLAGFDVNLGRLSKKMDKFGLTFTVLKIWNRVKGHSNVHLTEDLRIISPINIDLGYKEPMDIDLTGMNYSIALSYKF